MAKKKTMPVKPVASMDSSGQKGVAAASIKLMPSSKRLAIAAGIILVLALLAYSNSFGTGFHFDDYHQVVNNQHIRQLGNIPSFFRDASAASYELGQKGYRPLLYASFAANYAINYYWGPGYHEINLLLHLLNSLLVFLIAGAVLRAGGRERTFMPALAASLLFALHPVQTSAVTYISGRSALLASFFCLASFLCFVLFRFAEKGARRLLLAFLAVVLFFAGLLSKETAICLPGLFIVYDLLFVLPGTEKSRRYNAFLFYIPLIIAAATYLVIRSNVLGYTAVGQVSISVHDYLLSEAKVFLLYLRLMALPFNQNADYNLPLTTTVNFAVLISVLLVISLTVLLWKARKKNPAGAFFGLWFLIALAPESSIFPILDTAVEYRLYFPAVGFIVALASFLPERLYHDKRVAVGAAAIILLFGALSFNRNAVWATEVSLWSDVAAKSPDSIRAHDNLGTALLNERDYDGAIKELSRAIPTGSGKNAAHVYLNLGLLYEDTSRPGEAIESYKKAIGADLDLMEARENLGAVYNLSGRYAEAAAVLEEAVQRDPGYAWTHYNLAETYKRLGRRGDELKEMEAASKCLPDDFSVAYKLAEAYKDNGMKKEAAQYARVASDLANNPGQRAAAEALLSNI